MNTKHKVFADAYKMTKGLTEDLIKSYQVAYPNANKEVARVNGYKLHQMSLSNKRESKMSVKDYKANYKIIQEFNKTVESDKLADKKFQPKKWKKR